MKRERIMDVILERSIEKMALRQNLTPTHLRGGRIVIGLSNYLRVGREIRRSMERTYAISSNGENIQNHHEDIENEGILK